MEDRPVAQATGSNNNIVEVYPQRMELHSGWQNQRTETLDLKEVSMISIKGWVNCALTVQTNKGRQYKVERMSLPEARGIKMAVESQKQKAGLYD